MTEGSSVTFCSPPIVMNTYDDDSLRSRPRQIANRREGAVESLFLTLLFALEADRQVTTCSNWTLTSQQISLSVLVLQVLAVAAIKTHSPYFLITPKESLLSVGVQPKTITFCKLCRCLLQRKVRFSGAGTTVSVQLSIIGGCRESLWLNPKVVGVGYAPM